MTIKVFHTLAGCRSSPVLSTSSVPASRDAATSRVGLAAVVVAGEGLVFAGNGFRCPLTALAKRYGAESGSVTDIYLPDWFAHNMPVIHAPCWCS